METIDFQQLEDRREINELHLQEMAKTDKESKTELRKQISRLEQNFFQKYKYRVQHHWEEIQYPEPRKQTFIHRASKQMDVLYILLNNCPACDQALSEFDKKILNARILKVLNDYATQHAKITLNDPVLKIEYDGYRHYSPVNSGNKVEYINTSSFKINIVTDQNNRIQYEQTKINLDKKRNELVDSLLGWQQSIYNYEECKRELENLQTAIKNWESKYDCNMRDIIGHIDITTY